VFYCWSVQEIQIESRGKMERRIEHDGNHFLFDTLMMNTIHTTFHSLRHIHTDDSIQGRPCRTKRLHRRQGEFHCFLTNKTKCKRKFNSRTKNNCIQNKNRSYHNDLVHLLSNLFIPYPQSGVLSSLYAHTNKHVTHPSH